MNQVPCSCWTRCYGIVALGAEFELDATTGFGSIKIDILQLRRITYEDI